MYFPPWLFFGFNKLHIVFFVVFFDPDHLIYCYKQELVGILSFILYSVGVDCNDLFLDNYCSFSISIQPTLLNSTLSTSSAFYPTH